MKKLAKRWLAIVLSIIMICSMPTVSIKASGVSDQITIVGTCNYAYAYEVFKLVNEERKAAGLSELVLSESLLDTAMLRARENSVYWSHTRPNGELCYTAFPSGNWYSGENIAVNQQSPEYVMECWMNSTGHKANILSSNYNSIGIGCFVANGVTYWVQCFGTVTSDAISSVPSNATYISPISYDSTTVANGALNISAATSSLKAGDSTSISAMWTNASWSYAKITVYNSSLKWKSSNTSVATVDSLGRVTAKGAGTATITATTKAGTFSATTSVTVTGTATTKVSVTGITLSKSTLSLKTGGTATLTKTVKPSTATNKKVTWKSSDTSVATVDSTGKVTAVAAGTATITCTAKDGSKKKATCKVTVTKPTVKVTGITLSKTKLSLKVGKSASLTKTVKPSTATNKKVTWKSSNTSVATVDSTGKVTAVAAGTATITCTAKDGSKKKATCKVTVTKQKVTGISLNITAMTVKKGSSVKLTKNIKPTTATNKKVTWKSSNKSVVTVDSSGNVKAVGVGTATITCTAKDGSGKKATCKVTVKK